MKIKIFFAPWTRHWKPKDIVGFNDDGFEIIRPGAVRYVHSGWNACYKMTVEGKQYGRYIVWSESKEGWFPSPLRGSQIYKEAPKMLYEQALQDYHKLIADH